MKRLLLLMMLLLTAAVGVAKEAEPLARDVAVEKRMVAISEELRCLVCQNESLASSHADLAADLRNQIRIMIKAGKSDDEIMTFMTDRYGDFVRYRPPLKLKTVLLWFGPFLLLVLAIVGLFRFIRRQNAQAPSAPLSAEDEAQLAQLLGRKTPSDGA